MTTRSAGCGVLALVLGASCGGKPAAPKQPTADGQVARYTSCLAALDHKDWDTWGHCYTQDATSTFVDMGQPVLHGRAMIVEKGLRTLTSAFPDLATHPLLILQNGDKIASVVVMTGTQSGTLVTQAGEHPASHKKVGLHVIHVAELASGEPALSKDWYFADVRTLLRQIGADEGPHRAALAPDVAPPTIVIAKHDDREKANLAIYQQSVDAFNKHDVQAFDALLADDYQNIYATEAEDVTRKEKAVQHAEAFKLFSDLAWKPSDIWAAGDYVIAVASITGTNDGDFSDTVKKTGKKIDLTGVEIMKIVDGKVKQHWEFYNAAALSMQLGFMKPAERH